MKLVIHGEGVGPDEIDRGVGAAWEVFREGGVTPFEAAVAFCVCSQWDGCTQPGTDIPTDAERRAASLWKKAEYAGADASRAVANTSWLELRDD